ncbi:hypothetical protein B0H11DRAFT_1694619, partial [Mycena galericulata]
MSDSIPPSTTDRIPEHFFSRLFEISDIERMKRKLRDRSLNSTHGVDYVSYHKIATFLVGILKLGKPGDDPDSYRLVPLECCLLKCLTLLINMCIRAWVETYNILPDSQNGFGEKHRTHNNSFILRCAIDRDR